MPDCFVSYSSVDASFANAVHVDLSAHGVDVFSAAISLQPGDQWAERIHTALANSKWVVFLASRAACASPYVQQEIGRAVDGSKQLIPVVWDMSPSELPGWANRFHALDIRGQTPQRIQARIVEIAQRIKQDKANGLLLAGALVVGLFVLASRGQ